jgi:hypothetical protein
MKQILTRWPLLGRQCISQRRCENGRHARRNRAMEPIPETDPDSPSQPGHGPRIHDSGDFPKARQKMGAWRPASADYWGRLHWALLFALEAKKMEALREGTETLTYAGPRTLVRCSRRRFTRFWAIPPKRWSG